MSGAGIQLYAQLPPCVDEHGHNFTIPPGQLTAVCRRCGLVSNRKVLT